jgi:Bacterial extracellular solute-binding proteins, family 3
MQLRYGVISLTFCLFLLFFSSTTQGQTPSGLGQETPTNLVFPVPSLTIPPQNPENSYEFKFGIVEDSEPVSTDARGLNTYCHALEKYLDEYAPKEVTIEFSQRFKHHEGVAIECGPNSITSKRISDLQDPTLNQGINGFFSEPFFRTETKIIIKNSKRNLLKREGLPLSSFTEKSDSSFTVGVIKNTTSEEALKSIYPNAIRKETDRRKTAIASLQSNDDDSIDAYVSDEVLLPSMLRVLPSSDFSVEPKLYGLTNEYYGIVLYDDPKSVYPFDALRAKVNTWIGSEEGQKERGKLEKEISYSSTSSALKAFVSSDILYSLPSFLLFSLMFFLPIAAFFFIIFSFAWIAKIPLFSVVLNRIRSRGQNNNKIAQIINVFVSGANNTLIPQYIDRDTVITLLREVGDPLLQSSNNNVPPEMEVEKVAENLVHKAKNDLYLLKVLKALLGTVKDATREETDKWLRSVITRVFEKIEQTISK